MSHRPQYKYFGKYNTFPAHCGYFALYVLQTGQTGRVAQFIGHLSRKSGVLGSIPGLATYFRFSLRFFKKGSCQLLAKVCARSTGQPLRRSKPAQESVDRLTDRPDMTLDVYRGR